MKESTDCYVKVLAQLYDTFPLEYPLLNSVCESKGSCISQPHANNCKLGGFFAHFNFKNEEAQDSWVTSD